MFRSWVTVGTVQSQSMLIPFLPLERGTLSNLARRRISPIQLAWRSFLRIPTMTRFPIGGLQHAMTNRLLITIQCICRSFGKTFSEAEIKDEMKISGVRG